MMELDRLRLLGGWSQIINSLSYCPNNVLMQPAIRAVKIKGNTYGLLI